MKIINKTARLICIQTKEGRVDVLPGVITDNKILDKLKGKNQILDYYLENGDFKEVGGSKGPSEKELLVAEAIELGIENADTLSVKKLKAAIFEKENQDN
jgi:hypothetical protein